ncbi:flagellar export chaperone FliS [Pseudomarimonas salicorniae]|uniref:Flagellar secretion chaperone FliS n=1 Tax=Pseudomarimonas salicorniae TaxID=2933270 RepID=A0ABT0GL93_9GAMM|nr:flagellar export chaperone FliS [Lysobacter sp. CAU 1642]MCK7595157.1 flagellar export chaperone FliS [Lysobacter sp. CAU 1642]
MYPPRGSADAYRSAAIHSGVELPPERKLALLLGGIIDRLKVAESQIQNGQMAEKLRTIDSVLTILEALQASLDFESGGAIAEQLSSVYTTAEAQLVQANAGNDVAKLQSVIRLLTPIREAFQQISVPTAPADGADEPRRG